MSDRGRPRHLLTNDRVGRPKDRQPLVGHLANDPNRQAGPGNGCRQTIAREPQLEPDRAHLVLEERPERFDEFEVEIVGNPRRCGGS